MNSKEFRTGNLVYFSPKKSTKRVCNILEIHRQSVIVNDLGFGMELFYINESLQFIIITEEWLLKLGFLKRDDGYYFIKDSDLFIIQVFDKYVEILIEGEEDIVSWKKIEYVHQLQNYCYHIAGVELSVS